MVRKKEDSPRIKSLKKNARRRSIKEGIFAAAKSSFGDYYISPFAIAINTSNSLVALLSSISGLLGPLTQTFSSRLMEKHSRKKILLSSVFFEALMWLPFIAIAILFHRGILTNLLPYFLLASFAVYIILANIGSPAWFSWIGDLIDEKHRGRFFSKRNLIIGFVLVILTISASFFLNYFKEKNWTLIGFSILFSLALIFRIACWQVFKKQYEPKIKLEKGYYFSFWDFLKKAPKNNFGKFSIFRFFLSLACSISTPLLAIYLLKNLGFNYTTYIIIILSSSIFSLLILELWGSFADKYGNYRVFKITTLLIPTLPLLWIVFPFPLYLIFVPALISGISWAGFNLATTNFIYENVSQQKRGLALSYSNMLNGVGIFLGAGIGALLIQFLNISFIPPIFLIFIIGAIARMVVVFWWLPKIKEIRITRKIDSSKALKNLIFKQVKPTLLEEAHEIMSIKKYFKA